MSEMTAYDRLELLDRFQREDDRRRRRTARTAWGSVALATLVLTALVFVGLWNVKRAQHELMRIGAQRDRVRDSLDELQRVRIEVEADLLATRQQLGDAKAQVVARTQVLGLLEQKQLEAILAKQFEAEPQSAELLPRAYIHIGDRQDRAWAKSIGSKLELAGIVVPGVQFVPDAAHLARTDVRYYPDSNAGMERIVAILKKAGVDATPSLLRRKDPNDRANHFEIWFAPGSRNGPPEPRRNAVFPKALRTL
jgi:hypothetical protein